MPASLDLYLSAPSITATPSIDLKDINGSTVFRIITHTPSGASGGTSTLSRIKSEKDSGISLSVMVGIIEWRSVGKTVFCTGDGENRSIEDYLPRQGSMSRCVERRFLIATMPWTFIARFRQDTRVCISPRATIHLDPEQEMS